jgi:hypothetical protein
VVRRAPTARDITDLGSDYYLNLKGNPLGDTCVYARSFAALKRAGKAPVVTYAHIARERGHSGSVVGPTVTRAFCAVVADASGLLNAQQRSSVGTTVALAVVIVLIVAFLVLTRWRPVDLEHLRARRAFGQLIRAARQLYGRHWRPMVLIALTARPIVGARSTSPGCQAPARPGA